MVAKDLTGMSFGTLTVVGFDEERHNQDIIKKQNGEISRIRRYWLCYCSKCQKTYSIRGENLLSGNTKGCVCDMHDRIGDKKIKHGLSHTRLAGILNNMKQRCYNENSAEYYLYGGRGIRVCDEWLESSQNFYDWARSNGYIDSVGQKECSIDRIDVDGNYCPENCRFVDSFVQANNKRNNIKYEYNGECHTLTEWARIVNINSYTLYQRINRLKWTIEEALTLPPSPISQRK